MLSSFYTYTAVNNDRIGSRLWQLLLHLYGSELEHFLYNFLNFKRKAVKSCCAPFF